MGPMTLPQGGKIDSRASMEAARATRRELENQIESVGDRRGNLVQQRHNADATGNTAVVREMDAQIAQLGARLSNLEKQKIQLDDAIMDAVRRGVGQETQRTPAPGEPWSLQPGIPVPPTPPVPGEVFTLLPPQEPLTWLQINAERLLVGQGILFALFGVVLWRVARRGRRAPEMQGGVEMRQALDAIAVEVERISENQRYVTKLVAERIGEAPAQAMDSSAKDRVNAR